MTRKLPMGRRGYPSRLASILLALAAVTGVPRGAAAQAAPDTGAEVIRAPKISAPSVSLAEAVRLTVANDPQIRLARQDVATSTGELQQARGPFDWTLRLTPAFTYNNTALAPSVRHDEENRRLKLQAVAVAFGIVNRNLLDTLATLPQRPPRCPIQFASASQILNENASPLSFTFPGMPLFENANITLDSGFSETLRTFKNTGPCASDSQSTISANSGLLSAVWSGLAPQLTGVPLEDAIVTLAQTPHEVLGFSQQIAETVASRATLAFDRLGVVPLDELVSTLKIDGSFFKQFRNGMTGNVHAHLESDYDHFKHKSLDANFGGLPRPIMFPSQIGAGFTLPFARGRGVVSVDAPERAAALTVTARTDRLRHTGSEEVFRTVLAYLDLVGAQETVRSLEESAGRQGQIGQLTQQVINAGEMASVELSRVQARTAAVATSLAQARRALVDARLSLAEAMGVDVDTLANAPLAADAFSSNIAKLPDVASLIQAALSSRFDVRALGSLSKAAQILERGAFSDMRPRVDMSVDAGMTTFYEDRLFFFLGDELNPVFTQLPQEAPFQPSGDAVRFGNPVGIYRAWFKRPWKPYATVNLTIDFPTHNHTRRGRAVQAQASLRQTQIQEQDLTRVIQENVVDEAKAVQLAAQAVERRQAAVESSQQTLDGALERFRQNDITLIDTLLTEENLTQDRLALVRAWQDYETQLARLRFETGTLVFFAGEGVNPDQVRFDPTELVRK